jgi:hypothetical protein
MTAAVHSSDLRAMISDAPQVFTFQGQEYTGTISGQNMKRELELGGFEEGPEITLVISIVDADGARPFVTLPIVGQQITIGTKAYRIDRTEVDPFNVGFQMDLRSAHR